MVRALRSTAHWILLADVLNNFEKSSVASGDQRIFILGAKDLVYLPTYSFVRDEHSAVQRCPTFFHLLPKLLIVVELGCDQFLEDLIRAFPQSAKRPA